VNVINAAEMWFLRKMPRISYIIRIVNEEEEEQRPQES
jgi:hypothetical protein